MHTFPEQKSEHWIKPGFKFLFHFVYVLEFKVFLEGILGVCFYHPINQANNIKLSVINKPVIKLFVYKCDWSGEGRCTEKNILWKWHLKMCYNCILDVWFYLWKKRPKHEKTMVLSVVLYFGFISNFFILKVCCKNLSFSVYLILLFSQMKWWNDDECDLS